MNKTDKQNFVVNLKGELENANIIILAHYSGLTVTQVNLLRSSAKKQEVNVKVAKNSLIKLALENTDFSSLQDNLSGPTIMIFADNIVSAAKVLVDFAKKNEQLAIRTASFNKSLMSTEEIINLSKMPSLDEIRAKLIGLMSTPAQKLAYVLQAPASSFVRVIQAYSKK